MDAGGAGGSTPSPSLAEGEGPRARVDRAECLARSARPDEAGAVFRQLLVEGICPDDLLPTVAAGLGQLGEYGAALGACLELLRRSPDFAEAHFGVAFYVRRLGRPVEAILPVVARAHELAPDIPLYRITLATLLDHLGRRDEAREILGDLDLDAVSCRGCVRRMSTIFHQPGATRPEPAGRTRPDRTCHA